MSKHGPHGPNCKCHGKPHRFKVAIKFEALVHTKASADKITEMLQTIGLLISTTGTPVQLTSDIYTQPGDDGHEEGDEIEVEPCSTTTSPLN